MKRWLIGLALIAPALLLIFFSIQPSADLVARLPLFHFYIVTFITFAAAVISILLSAALGPEAQPRHVLAAVAFAVIAIIFFTHGLATPGALLAGQHPLLSWSAWLTMFGGGAVFALAGLDTPAGRPEWLSVRRITIITAVCTAVYLSIGIFLPQWLSAIDAQVAPWHKLAIFAVTVGLWLFAAYRLWRTWRVTHNRVDGALAFVALWLAQATVSLHLYPVWNLSWWLYHFVLLVAFLMTVYILTSEYERARQFNLVPYYVAVSLIVTALLALLASNLFADYAYNTLVGEIESATAEQIDNLTGEIDATLAHDISLAEARSTYAARLSQLPIGNIRIYAANGAPVYPTDATAQPGWAKADQQDFASTLQGHTLVEVFPPDNPPPGYTPAQSTYTLQTYSPLHVSSQSTSLPIGVLVTLRDVPDLNAAILNARATGLLIAAATMGLLFVALLWVVRRADRIITARTNELAVAYTTLRQSESIRNDLTNMIVHDLRTPLTAITASLDLLTRFTGEGQAETRTQFVQKARAASRRMTGLIDDMLTVSKIEAGELEPQLDVTPLAELLADRVGAFTAQATAENKQLTFDCDPDLTVRLDRALIGRVLENLVSNAFKYTEEGEGAIRVSAHASDNRIYVSVRDNGEGVLDDYKQHIFGKFAQAPNAANRPARKGTGLGLAFCRLVVEAHGGQIKVDDAPGGGSDFIFWLPQD